MFWRNLIVIITLLTTPGLAAAQGDTVEDIVKALTPQPSFETPGARSMRGILATPAAAPPSIDIRVEFAYNSAELDEDAIIILSRLGEALSDPSLASYHFKIGGHTDARGSDDFNMDLSLRRARAVVAYLEGTLGIGADRLEAEGFGESQLYDPSRPEDGVNRRVQIVNLGAI